MFAFAGSIKNFRQFNILAGTNNAGKSTVMEALYLASTANRKVILCREIDDDNILYNAVLLSNSDLLGNIPIHSVIGDKYSGLNDNTINIANRMGEAILSVKVADSKSPVQAFGLDLLRLKNNFPSSEEIILFAFDYSKVNKDYESTENLALAELINDAEDSCTNEARTVFCWHPSLTYHNKGSATWTVEGQNAAPQHTFFCDMSVLQGYIPGTFFHSCLNKVPGWNYRIAEHFAAIFDLDPSSFIVQFIPPNGGGGQDKLQGWISYKDKPPLSIDNFGKGARAALRLLVPLITMAEMATEDAPGLLLLESPEVFQYPKTLGNLLREIVKIISNKPIQVFISTHNLEMITYVTQMLEKEEIDPQDAIFFI